MEKVRPRECNGLFAISDRTRFQFWSPNPQVTSLSKASWTNPSIIFFSLSSGYHSLTTSLWVQESVFLNDTVLLSLSAETTELGSKKELKSMPFITYLSGLLTAQMLSDDQLISGVEIRCEEKGRCPSTCHLCRRPGKEQVSPTPVLLEINRVVPLYTLIQDNGTKEVSSPDTATKSDRNTSPPASCPHGPPVGIVIVITLQGEY